MDAKKRGAHFLRTGMQGFVGRGRGGCSWYLAPALGEKQRVFQNHLETAQHLFLAAARLRLQLGGTAGDHGGGELGRERGESIIPLRRGGTLHSPSLPVHPRSQGPSPTRPHLPCVAISLTQKRHRGLLGLRGLARAEKPGGGWRAMWDKLP